MINERVKQRRKQLNLTTRELADLTGVAQQQISRYEKNGTGMKAETLKHLALALGVSTDYLLGLTDDFSFARPSFSLDVVTLLHQHSPEKVALLIRKLGVQIEPKVLIIDQHTLLDRYSPLMVAHFLSALGVTIQEP